MDSQSEKPQKKLTVSKNRKKTWRKHIKCEEVEEFLIEKRREERTGGPLDQKADDKLFFSDTTATPANSGGVRSKGSRLDRPLRCYQILLSDSQVPPAYTPCRKPRTSQKHQTVSKKVKTVVAPAPVQTTSIQGEAGDLRKSFDLWAPKVDTTFMVLKDKDLVDYYKEQTRLKGRKVPKSVYVKPSGLPAVEVPPSGTSYNPTYVDHQEVLREAHEVEMKKEKEEERLKRRLTDKFPTLMNAPTVQTWIKEMSFGIIDDPNESEEEVRDGPLSINPPVRADKKKQLSKRRKQEALKKKQAEMRRQKEREKKENEILKIRVIKKQVEKDELKFVARGLRREAKKRAKAFLPAKTSRNKYEAPAIDVQLTSELASSLRQMKQEGCLLLDRYKSFQRRNVIDTRIMQKAEAYDIKRVHVQYGRASTN